MSITKAYPWIRSSADFVSVKSGNWDDRTTWKIAGVGGVLYDSPYTPQRGNNVYISPTHTVTLTKNEECNDCIYVPGEDIVKVNTGTFALSVFGLLKNKLGAYPGTTTTGGNGIGTAQWVVGTIDFRGKSRTLDFPDYRSSLNKYGTTINIYLDPNEVFTIFDSAFINNAIAIGGAVNVHSGILKVDSSQMRVAQTRTNTTATDGTITVNAGGKLVVTTSNTASQNRINRSSTTSLSSVVVNAGGVLETDKSSRIASVVFSMLGDVVVDGDSVDIITGSTGFNGSVPISSFFNLFLKGTGTKTAINAIAISGKLSFNNTTQLALGAFALTYDTNASLEILTNKTRGVELPAAGSGTAICKDLVIPTGVVYDLGGATVNIRGALTGGGTVTNGTLNQNQL